MKLQRQMSYRYKNKICYKYVIIIPKETIKKLDWKFGEELDSMVKGKRLILKPKD